MARVEVSGVMGSSSRTADVVDAPVESAIAVHVIAIVTVGTAGKAVVAHAAGDGVLGRHKG